MLTVQNIGLQFGKRILFDDVNLQFTHGNCYGIIGANGSGKSTFLKILSDEISSTEGQVILEPNKRMAVLRQDHHEFDELTVIDAVIRGHKKMYDLMVEKNAIYMDPEATEAEAMRAADMEQEFGEMGGWMAETEAAELLSNMGVKEANHDKRVKELSGVDTVKVLIAQALFGEPDILLLDEPTNDLDASTIEWLADFLADFKNTVIVVSHDRYFLDMVCTHIADIDFGKINIYSGNYTFWHESSQLILKQRADKNKKTEAKRKELLDFISRFSANASKSKQATSRKKALEKLKLEDLKPSSRKYPYIHFKPERIPGNDILSVKNLSIDGLISDLSFVVEKDDKIAFIAPDDSILTAFFQVLAGERTADSGSFEFGQTISHAYVPNNNSAYFEKSQNVNLVEWLSDYSDSQDEQFLRGWLGRMLFSGEEVLKKAAVLSGGEKVRCMMAKTMLKNPNFLLMDQPTNHLDLESITALNDGMTEFKGSILFASHDHQLVQTVANRIIEITPNGNIDMLMSLEDYLHSSKVAAKREALVQV